MSLGYQIPERQLTEQFVSGLPTASTAMSMAFSRRREGRPDTGTYDGIIGAWQAPMMPSQVPAIRPYWTSGSRTSCPQHHTP